MEIKSIIKAIQTCAEDLGIKPNEVEWNEFQSWHKKLDNNHPIQNIHRKELKRLGGFTSIRDAHFFPEISKENIEIKHQSTFNKKQAQFNAADELFFKRFEEILVKSQQKIVIPKLSTVKPSIPERYTNTIWSDLHFGADLDPNEVPIKYGRTEEARRMAGIVAQIADDGRLHRKETALVIHLLGDIIQNHLYDDRDGAPLAEQMNRAIWILTQAIAFLAVEYPKGVTVYCSPGNHGRFTSRHKDRAVCQKWDSAENVIYFAIKMALSHISNIKVHIPQSPYYTYKLFGMSGFMTHFDTVIDAGYPGKIINVEKARKAINEINSKLSLEDRHQLFGGGHVHTHSVTELPNRVTLITNGCLIPPDAYAVSIGIIDTSCSQTIWETVPNRMCGYRRPMNVGEDQDKDESLDRIIKPFSGF